MKRSQVAEMAVEEVEARGMTTGEITETITEERVEVMAEAIEETEGIEETGETVEIVVVIEEAEGVAEGVESKTPINTKKSKIFSNQTLQNTFEETSISPSGSLKWPMHLSH